MSSRTYGWADPRQTAEASQTMAGIDFLRAMMNGQLAQCAYQQTMDYDLVEVGDGRVMFAGKAAEYMLNPLGSVHGGYYAGMLDSALGCAIHSRLPAGQTYTTLEFKLNMVRAIPTDGRVIRAIGEVVHPGRKIATSEARLEDDGGKLYAHATCSCMIFSA
ncbi:MAG: PaaI family thioesterase [Alphaproteobacteria bacterium]|nr:PaaI family thioesterase [Alphaproteobacteria bacterium]